MNRKREKFSGTLFHWDLEHLALVERDFLAYKVLIAVRIYFLRGMEKVIGVDRQNTSTGPVDIRRLITIFVPVQPAGVSLQVVELGAGYWGVGHIEPPQSSRRGVFILVAKLEIAPISRYKLLDQTDYVHILGGRTGNSATIEVVD